MAKQAVEAIFEAGAFKPLKPLDSALAEGQHVRLLIENTDTGPSVLDLACHVYDGLEQKEIDEIEAIALKRSPFFTGRDPV